MDQVIKSIEIFNGKIISQNEDELIVKGSDNCREDFIIYVIMNEFFTDVVKVDDKIIGQCPIGDVDPY